MSKGLLVSKRSVSKTKLTHNQLVPGSSPGGTTLKTPLLEGFFVFQHVKCLLGINMGIKSISFVPWNNTFPANRIFKEKTPNKGGFVRMCSVANLLFT